MYLIIRRKVNDYEAWKAVVSDNATRKAYGSRGMTAYRSAADPNEIIAVFEWDDQHSYRDYFNLPEVQQALAQTGVGAPQITEASEFFWLDG